MTDDITTLPSVTGDDWVRCLKCGSEAPARDGLIHEDGCPVEVDE